MYAIALDKEMNKVYLLVIIEKYFKFFTCNCNFMHDIQNGGENRKMKERTNIYQIS